VSNITLKAIFRKGIDIKEFFRLKYYELSIEKGFTDKVKQHPIQGLFAGRSLNQENIAGNTTTPKTSLFPSDL
jgi:hypothetical protein